MSLLLLWSTTDCGFVLLGFFYAAPCFSPQQQPQNVKGRGVEANPLLWGVPGHLTSDEADVYLQFQAVVHNRVAADDTAFYDTIFGFGREEGEVWALCRFLRHAKFDLPKTIALVEEGQRVRATAAAANFYPNPTTALGCDPALYYHQFPQLYTGGFDKTGVPVFISKPGQVNSTAIQTLTDVTHIVQLHWYLMARDLAQRLVQRKAQYPNTRYVPFRTNKGTCVRDDAVDWSNQASNQFICRCRCGWVVMTIQPHGFHVHMLSHSI